MQVVTYCRFPINVEIAPPSPPDTFRLCIPHTSPSPVLLGSVETFPWRSDDHAMKMTKKLRGANNRSIIGPIHTPRWFIGAKAANSNQIKMVVNAYVYVSYTSISLSLLFPQLHQSFKHKSIRFCTEIKRKCLHLAKKRTVF